MKNCMNVINQPALVLSEQVYLRKHPGALDGKNDSGIEDEIFSGWAVACCQAEENGWILIETHYGYTGYVQISQLQLISYEQLRQRQNRRRFKRIQISLADLLDQPRVQGLPLEHILKNAIVEVLEPELQDGWCKIRTAAGREGYLRTAYLKDRQDNDGYLLEKLQMRTPMIKETDPDAEETYFHRCAKDRKCEIDEAILRNKLAESARTFLKTQYRWGGKSSQGIDCSGLVFMSYLDNGILIYRDAQILPEYPIHTIAKEELKTGDLIFFPGHVALYLGGDRFIHATAYQKTPYVTINSLNPAHEDYRSDLAERIEACGSLW